MASVRCRLIVAGLVLPFILVACDGAPVPAALEHVSGGDQQGEVGQVLEQELVVRAVDRDGEPAAAVEVRFVVASGGGSVEPGSVLTGRDGLARAVWTLGTEAGEQVVHAIAEGLTGSPVVFTALAEPGPTVEVEVIPAHWETSPGETRQFTAVGYDQYGNVTGVEATWASSAPSVVQVDQNGVATVVGLGDAEIVATIEEVQGTATVESRQEPTVSAGGWHSCGVTGGGRAFCWGFGQHGALGTGSWSSPAVPAEVAGGHRFHSLSAGARHSCGVSVAGVLYCWGNNDQGQLGIGSFTSQNAPRQAGVPGYLSVSAGMYHTCALTTDGAAHCWGDNSWGQLGTGEEGGGRTAPGAVSGGHTFTEISTGVYHTCGRATNGAVYCWGLNVWNQLGAGSEEYSVPIPIRADPARTYASVVAGATFSCGLTEAGATYCWGNNLYGQLGHESEQDANPPMPAAPGFAFASLHTRGWYVCGVQAIGDAYCWGSGGDGQLGHGQMVERQPSPVPVQAGGLLDLAPGYWHSLALDPDRALAWGWNEYGQLGDGTTARRLTPVEVVGWDPFGALQPAEPTGFAPAAPPERLRSPRDVTPREIRH